ncbi:MAG: methyltransferase [Treponema sp.]|nr:methyltransferase [Treponema sp.]
MDFTFDLSQGLFSSAGVDAGTQLLLKVFSRVLDEDNAAGKSPPRRVLDSGCGAGIIGICAAAAILRLARNSVLARCQDRDELARLVTLHNARLNNIPPARLKPVLSRCSPGAAAGTSFCPIFPQRRESPCWKILSAVRRAC